MLSAGSCSQLVSGNYDVVLMPDNETITNEVGNQHHQSSNLMTNGSQHQDQNCPGGLSRATSNSSPGGSSGSALPAFSRVLTNYLERFEQLENELEQAIRAGQLASCGYANEFRLLKEFSKQLRQNKENLREGELDINQSKNRYKDIIPFNHTRVTLSHDHNIPGSDYINANYIRGASGSPQAYIACQGPLPGTLNDFWRMIWETRVSVLVMACNEHESGRSKCEIYWPNELDSSANYGPYEIRLLRVRQICQDFLVRKFSLKVNQHNRYSSLRNNHLFSNPNSQTYLHNQQTQSLRSTTSSISSASSNSSSNCCRNCDSANNTVNNITTSTNITTGNNNNFQNQIIHSNGPPNSNRGLLLQQAHFSQPITKGPTLTCIPSNDIAKANHNSIYNIDNNHRNSNLSQDNIKTSSLDNINRINVKQPPPTTLIATKTAASTTIPTTTLPKATNNNDPKSNNHTRFINNLNSDSDTSSTNMQVTPPVCPAQTTNTNTLINDNNNYNKIIITNNNANNPNNDNVITNFINDETNIDNEDSETRIICQFHYTTWPDHGAPVSMHPILEMVRLMREVQPAEERPILVHCSAGCGRTGTICCIDYVWGLLRRGELDPSFDLCSIISEMRQQRMAMVQTLEQYILCHRAVAALFIDQLKLIDDHTYENLDDLGPLDVVEATCQDADSVTGDMSKKSSSNEAQENDHDKAETNEDEDEDDDLNFLLDDEDIGPVFI